MDLIGKVDYRDNSFMKKVKVGHRAFEKLSQILEICSGKHDDCRSCPRIAKCILLWDRFVVYCVDDDSIESKKVDDDNTN
jgi:hypothetical protein